MKYNLIFAIVSLLPASMWGQCAETLQIAERALGANFIEIPQHLEGSVKTGETLSFEAVWLANNTYRIATSQAENQKIEVIILDDKKNPIFNSAEFNYPQVWDFYVEYSQRISCFVRYVSDSNEPHCLTVLTGFKK
jgi:hypothetical protein